MEKKSNLHPGCQCDGCGSYPLKGSRYRCSVCVDFDFCQACFKKNTDHKHKFKRIAFHGATPVDTGPQAMSDDGSGSMVDFLTQLNSRGELLEIEKMLNFHTGSMMDFPEKFNLRGKLFEKEKMPNLHPGVQCDGCKLGLVCGNRYKCRECDDFDYCEDCFKTQTNHTHDFLKITQPGKRPQVAGKPPKATKVEIEPDYDFSDLFSLESLDLGATAARIGAMNEGGGGKYAYQRVGTRFMDSLALDAKSDNMSGSTVDFLKKFNLRRKLLEKEKMSNLHPGVQCDGCKLVPVGGNRYKCRECEDFDYCEDCFKTTTDHKHDFVKITQPGKSPQAAGKPRSPLSAGDYVRVKSSVKAPKYKWGNIKDRRSIGKVTAIMAGGKDLRVDFRIQKNWHGFLSDMEVVDVVHSTITCDGCKLVPVGGNRYKCKECDDFDYCEDCFKTKTDHKHDFVKITQPGKSPQAAGKPRSPVRAGDYVRVKPTVKVPKYEWGDIKDRRSIGKVTAIIAGGEGLQVDFRIQKNWHGLLSDMEVVDVVHSTITCDGCKLVPIGGNRYKCKECDDYDYCEDCFKTKTDHKHDFVKITQPGKSPQAAGKPPNVTTEEIETDSDSGSDSDSSSVENQGGEGKCAYQSLCIRYKDNLALDENFFELSFDQCFCQSCHEKRGDNVYYKRGSPPKDYGLPIGWCKFGLSTPARAQSLNAFKLWHIAFHGTKSECIKKILDTGDLLMPGDVTLEGSQVSPPTNHWDPKNPEMKPPPGHDVRKIYLSPSIKYSGCDVYAPPVRFMDKATTNTYGVRVALQVRIKPDAYTVGPQTIGATSQMDPNFPNSELEWSTKVRGGVILTGLLVKIEGFPRMAGAPSCIPNLPNLPQD